jgi:hypothetical protein
MVFTFYKNIGPQAVNVSVAYDESPSVSKEIHFLLHFGNVQTTTTTTTTPKTLNTSQNTLEKIGNSVDSKTSNSTDDLSLSQENSQEISNSGGDGDKPPSSPIEQVIAKQEKVEDHPALNAAAQNDKEPENIGGLPTVAPQVLVESIEQMPLLPLNEDQQEKKEEEKIEKNESIVESVEVLPVVPPSEEEPIVEHPRPQSKSVEMPSIEEIPIPPKVEEEKKEEAPPGFDPPALDENEQVSVKEDEKVVESDTKSRSSNKTPLKLVSKESPPLDAPSLPKKGPKPEKSGYFQRKRTTLKNGDDEMNGNVNNNGRKLMSIQVEEFVETRNFPRKFSAKINDENLRMDPKIDTNHFDLEIQTDNSRPNDKYHSLPDQIQFPWESFVRIFHEFSNSQFFFSQPTIPPLTNPLTSTDTESVDVY